VSKKTQEEQNVFDLTLNEEYVTLKDAEGNEASYVMVEMTGEVRDQYMNQMRKKTKQVGDKTELVDFTGLHSDILVACMFLVTKNEKKEEVRKALKIGAVQKWPSRVLKALFDKAQKLSALDDDGDDKGKKEDGEDNDE